MKVCERCGDEISTRDGVNYCHQCENDIDNDKKNKHKEARKAKEEMLKSLGLVKVCGALGGTYWE